MAATMIALSSSSCCSVMAWKARVSAEEGGSAESTAQAKSGQNRSSTRSPASSKSSGTSKPSSKTSAPTSAPTPTSAPSAATPAPASTPGGGGKVVAERARTTWYNPINNDPSGSRNCAYRKECVSPDQGSPSSAAHSMKVPSIYQKGALYTVHGEGGAKSMCVRVDDLCAGCSSTQLDIFLEDGKSLPFDYAKITEGC